MHHHTLAKSQHSGAGIVGEGKANRPARRMNVVFLLSSLAVGGAEKQVVALINGMARDRFCVSLARIKPGDALLGEIAAGRCEGGSVCLGVKQGFEFRGVRRLAAFIEERQADLVVCTNMYALGYAWLSRQFSRHKPQLIEVFHTTDISARKEHLKMLLYRHIVRRAQLLIYVSTAQAAQWRRQGLRAEQESVIQNGIDTERFRDTWSAQAKLELRRSYGFDANDYVVGLCAVMRPEKAHGDLLASLKRLRDEGVPVKCVFMGDGPERSRVEAQIRDLDLGEHVRITGFIQDVRLPIAACDVMVLASRAVETFSLAALEAMALGKPMVMTNIGGAAEQVTPGFNGLLFEVGDTAALAACLKQLSDTAVRAALGRNAAERVRSTWDVSHMVRSYEATFETLLASRRPAAVPAD